MAGVGEEDGDGVGEGVPVGVGEGLAIPTIRESHSSEIKTDAMDIDISVPIIKLGALIRLPGTNLSLNPYLGYNWEHVKTGYSDRWTDTILYGITARWYWRMIHVTAKYYLEDNLNRNERYNVVRVRSSCFITKHVGIALRFEYMEHSIADNTSFLFGPVFIF